jgi:hypothetical protein
MSRKYVLIKGTKEKLEVIEITETNTLVKNSKGQVYKIPNEYLITSDEYDDIKLLKKLRKKEDNS